VYGQYQVIERIAVGGMAEIFLGRVQGVEGFERPVVIKKVRRRYSKDDRFHAMLIREAKITATLSHPNIVQILDLGQSDKDEYFIVMEYVDGRDLRSCMDRARTKQRPLELEAMVYIAMEVCAALDYAHRKTDKEGRTLNLIHRDVSPANVLISTSGEVKLADFGIARYGRDVSAVGSLKGKLGYMSPEQARAEPVDQRSDIFSVGAVLFEAALGQRPFSAQTDLALLQQVQAAEITAPSSIDSEVPGELERILLKAMAPAPRDRYSGAEQLAAALRRFQFNHSAARVGPEQLASLLRGLFGPGVAKPPGKRAAARFIVNTITGVHRASISGLQNPLFGEALTSIGKPSEALLGEMMKDLKTDELGLEEYDPPVELSTDPDPPIDNLATDPMGFTGGLDLMKIVTNILPPDTIDDLAQQTRGRSRGPLDDVATRAPEEAELEAIARSMPELAIRNAPGAADGRGLEEPPTPPLDDEASDAGLEPLDEVSTPAMGTPGLAARLASRGSGQIVVDDSDELPTSDLPTSDLPTSDLPTSDLPTSDLQQSEVLEVDDVAVELSAPDKGDAAVDEWPTPALADAPMAASLPALPKLTDVEEDEAPTSAPLASTSAPLASTAAPLASTAAPLASTAAPLPPCPQVASTTEATAEPTADPVLLPPVANYIAPRKRRRWGVWLVVALAGLLLGGGGATVLLLRPSDDQLAASPPLSSDSAALRREEPAAPGEVADPAPKTPTPDGPAPKQPATKLAGHTTAKDKPAVSKPAVSKPAVSKPAVRLRGPKLPDPKPAQSVKVARAQPNTSLGTEPGGSRTKLPRTSDDDRTTPARPPKRGKRGQVVIKSDPWAYIHVDGKRSKRTTSARPFSLPPGKHTIELVNPELGLRKRLEIEVQEGELVRRFVRLQ
jgi:serine/threonine protein kinase